MRASYTRCEEYLVIDLTSVDSAWAPRNWRHACGGWSSAPWNPQGMPIEHSEIIDLENNF